MNNSISASLRRENNGSKDLIKTSSSVVDDTEQGQRCLNKIDNKKKSLFIKVSIDTLPNNN